MLEKKKKKGYKKPSKKIRMLPKACCSNQRRKGPGISADMIVHARLLALCSRPVSTLAEVLTTLGCALARDCVRSDSEI